MMQDRRNGQKRHIYGYHNMNGEPGGKPGHGVMNLIAKSYNTGAGAGLGRHRNDPRGGKGGKAKKKRAEAEKKRK